VLGAQLGAGGMGVVYRARDERLGRDVAVKILPAAFRDDQRLRRFALEAKAAAALSHPNVLSVFDVSVDGEQPYLVTELLEGRTLAELLAEGPLPLKRALSLAAQAARGLSAAHARSIVHRDLKPSNLFVTREGVVKILDFGLAKVVDAPVSPHAETHDSGGTQTAHTVEGAVLGTVGYMAPEQVQGRPVDARSDLFAFGCVLYELLAGKRAFAGATPVETSYAILHEEPAPLPQSVGPAIARIVQRCLAKDPAERFQSARDLAFVLDDLSSADTTAKVDAPARPPRRRSWARLAVALPLALVSFAAAWWLRASPDRRVPHFSQLLSRSGGFSNMRFAPDGKSILFSAKLGADSFRVYLASAGSAEPRALTTDGNTALLAVSSGGELALLVDARMSPSGMGIEGTLARGNLAGGAPRPLVEHVVAADFSPDASELAVLRVIDGKHRLEFPLGHVLYETPNLLRSLRVSPSGRELALVELTRDSGRYSGTVVVLDRTGKRLRSSRSHFNVMGLAFWRDQIVASATTTGHQRQIITLAPDGKERTIVDSPDDLSIGDIAPNGQLLVCAGRIEREVAFARGDETPRRIATSFDTAHLQAVSADGTELLFTVMTDAGPVVYVRHADGTLVHLTDGSAFDLTRDGALALFGAGAPIRELGVTPTGAGVTRMLPRGTIDRLVTGVLVPDGKRVVFVGAEKDQRFRVWVQEVAGGPPRPLTPPDEEIRYDVTLRASADGSFVVYHDPKGARRVPLDGGASAPLPGIGPIDRVEQLSDDGRVAYVWRIGAGLEIAHIDAVDLASGAARPWRELGPVDHATVVASNPVIGPGARSTGYVSYHSEKILYLVDGAL
jgi:serine/threonine protein kinase